jgi:hypothetical protein
MTIPSLASTSLTSRNLPADRYHIGVRLGSIGLWVVILVALYAVVAYVLRLVLGETFGGIYLILLEGRHVRQRHEVLGETFGGIYLIPIIVALFLSQPVSRWAEGLLMQRWPSGRAVRLEDGALTLVEKSGPVRFDLSSGKANFWRWHFVVKNRRSGRVSNGDQVCALRLVQGEAVVSLYAFVNKKNVEALFARYPFFELQRATDPEKRPLGGREAVFFAAEQTRWESGAELDPADFEALLNHLAAYLPEFKSNTSS